MYGRQLAWLGQRIDPKDDKSRTRFEVRKSEDFSLNLPDVEAQHLLRYLEDIGWAQPSGMGIGGISSTEIMAWSRGMGISLDPWEFEAIRRASRAYCQQFSSNDSREPTFDPLTNSPKTSAVQALASALNRSNREDKA